MSGGSALDETDGHLVWIFLLTAITVGVATRYLCQRLHLELPYTSALLILTVILGLVQLGVSQLASAEMVMASINPLLLQFIFLPALLFEMALDINVRNFKRLLPVILILLIPGILITALLTAVLIFYGLPAYEWDWITCLLMGAILVATDTVPIVQQMKKAGVAERLSAIIEGESALVDCAGYILTTLFLEILVSSGSHSLADGVAQDHHSLDIGKEVRAFIQEAVCAPLWGYAIGIVVIFFLYRVINDALIEITATLGAAYVAFYVGQKHLAVNGALSVITFGLYVNHWQRHTISPSVLPSLHNVVKCLAYVATTLIYAIAGVMCSYYTFVVGSIDGTDVGYCFLLYFFLILTRATAGVLLLPVIRKLGYKMNWKDVFFFSWSGIRGVQALTLSLTVILNVSLDTSVIHRIGFQASGIVLLTNIINAPTAGWFMRFLRFKSDTPEARMVLNATIDQMKKEGEESIHTMKTNKQFEAASWDKVHALLTQVCDSAVKTYSSTHGNVTMTNSGSVLDRIQKSVLSTIDRLDMQKHAKARKFTTSVLMSPSSKASLAQASDSYDIEPSANGTPNGNDSGSVLDAGCINGNGNGNVSVSVSGAANTDFRQRDDLAERFLELQRTEYHRLYDTGCLTRAATVTLLKSIDVSLDRKDLGEQWKIIESALRVPRWLSYLYQQPKLRRWSLVNAFIHRQVFMHFCLSVEVSAAFVGAFDKLQEFLRKYPLLRDVNPEAMEEIEREAGVYAMRMKATFEDIRAAFPQVYSAVHSRHASLMVLLNEQHTVEHLHESGLLSVLEFERLEEAINHEYVALKRSKLENTLPSTESVLLSQEYSQHMHFMQQDWLVASAKRMLVAPNTWIIEELRDREPGVFVIARGQVATYFHRTQAYGENEQPADYDSRAIVTLSSPEIDSEGGHGLQQRVSIGHIVGARSLIDTKIDACKTVTTCELFFFPLAVVKPVLTDARFAECLMRVVGDELMKSSFYHLPRYNTMTAQSVSAVIAHSQYYSNDSNSDSSSGSDKSMIGKNDRLLLLQGHCDIEPKDDKPQSVTAPALVQSVTGPARLRTSNDARWLVWNVSDEENVLRNQSASDGGSATNVLTTSDFPWIGTVPLASSRSGVSEAESVADEGVEMSSAQPGNQRRASDDEDNTPV